MSKQDEPTDTPRKPFSYDEAFRVTESPNPNFKPGTGGAGLPFLDQWRKKGDEVGFNTIDPEKQEPRCVYDVLDTGRYLLNAAANPGPSYEEMYIDF